MITVQRRLESPRWLKLAIPVISVVLALVFAGLVLLATAHDPLTTYTQVVQAAFTGTGAFSATLISATPLVLTGLAAAIAFGMRVWNIGGEGQLYMGAIGASGIGLALGGRPAALVIAAMIVGGALTGAMWASIPGLLRAYLNTNEILTSLMLNYVAGLVLYYLIFDSKSYWRDLTSPSAKVFPQGRTLGPAATWPGITVSGLTIPFGLVLAVILAAALWVMLRSTPFGFEMRVIGDAPSAGRYAGMRTRRTLFAVMLLSGALAGIGGASQVGDFSHVLDPRGLQQAAYGYTGIVVAALARYSPLGAVLSAILLGALINAGFSLQGPSFPQGLVGVTEGIILFCVLAGELIARYRVGIRRRPVAPATHEEVSPAQSGQRTDVTVGKGGGA